MRLQQKGHNAQGTEHINPTAMSQTLLCTKSSIEDNRGHLPSLLCEVDQPAVCVCVCVRVCLCVRACVCVCARARLNCYATRATFNYLR